MAIICKVAALIGGWKIVVSGAENVPADGPVVLAINHAGYLDPIFAAWPVVFGTKRWVRFLAKKEVFDHKLAGPFMRAMKHVPVDRRRAPAKALELGIERLQQGEVLGMFPEATINLSFVPTKGKTGTVRMAQVSGAVVIPVAVWGSHRLLTKGRRPNLRRGVPILVNMGRPMELDPGENPKEATGRLMGEIRALLAEAQQRYPDQPASDEDPWWLPAHLGGTAPPPDDVLPGRADPGMA
ncbi:MAG: 1-acyl-sn-glycerol-3-phosphate acyltransferase [Actinomycetota bacterium]|nr:1-acyl-sn-glycerol-3-phosphate acyltransferase [Actinomycetota bacterium]